MIKLKDILKEIGETTEPYPFTVSHSGIRGQRYCEHEWGDADHDGHLECQKCGLFKPEWDDTH